MLKRIYLDNYKCFTAFTIEFGQLNLLLGKNGTGKSSVLDFLRNLQAFITDRQPLQTVFPESTMTKWDNRDMQQLELFTEMRGIEFSYKLRVKHDKEASGKSLILREELAANDETVFEFAEGRIRFRQSDGTWQSNIPADVRYSGIATLAPTNASMELSGFLRQIEDQRIIRRLDPFEMKTESTGHSWNITGSSRQFSDWYASLALERYLTVQKVTEMLKEVLQGFQYLGVQSTGEGRRSLVAAFRHGTAADEITYKLYELSEGQRQLIFLYTLLATSADGPTAIDEPENFVSMQEIQPLILSIMDSLDDESDSQWIIISHHPEYYDLLGEKYGIWFERTANGAIRLGESPKASGDLLTVSEIVARERN
jgi:predicted ATPase